MKAYNARQAEQESDVVVDMDGTIWVYVVKPGRWDYMTEHAVGETTVYALSGWDHFEHLPNEEGPYRLLDAASAGFIRNQVGQQIRVSQ